MKTYLSTTLTNGKGNGSTKVLVALLLSIIIVFVLKYLSESKHTSGHQKASESVSLNSYPQDYQTPFEAAKPFLNQMSESYPDSYTMDNGIATVFIRKRSFYRFYSKTTYQEIVTKNKLIRSIITHQLDNQGIEYQLLQTSTFPASAKPSWTISWGGVLYLPKI